MKTLHAHITDSLGLYALSDEYSAGVAHAFDMLMGGDAQGCDPPKDGEPIDVEDAFVEQDGEWFYAVQGNNGRKLRRFSKRSEAEDYVDFLHRKNKPGASSKGAAAKKKVAAQRRTQEE